MCACVRLCVLNDTAAEKDLAAICVYVTGFTGCGGLYINMFLISYVCEGADTF